LPRYLKNMYEKPNVRCVVFTGGGTGGHIYPGLAVAGAFRRQNPSVYVVWVGSSSGMDRTLVEKSGLADAFYGIPSGKFRRYFSLKTLPDIVKIVAGFFAAFFLLLKLKPCAVFSKGGYVSVPPCFASRALKIPVYTHECDFSPGLATKLNARAAHRVFVSYEQTANFFSAAMRARVIVTGNPVREAFYTADAQRGRQFLGLSAHNNSKPVLLVLGGSTGSKQINDLVCASLPFLTGHFFVVHQTGEQAGGQTTASGEQASREQSLARGTTQELPDYRRFAFIYGEMCDVIAASDVVVSRAGANSLAECAVCAKPLVLIPLEGSGTRGDQVENAAFFEKQGAALVLVPSKKHKSVTPEDLAAALTTMLEPARRKAFSLSVRRTVPAQRAADVIASTITAEVFRHERP
jgi:UDP-N-acetylglucosamine--N-acetylmuramyl-(pentapeptide) pyrophosphoryl-undecaprenol N-acetylglucosamine transferase